MNTNQINYLAAIIGFTLANILFYYLSGKIEGGNQSRSIFISIGSFTFHFHHWMIGLIALIFILIIEQYFGRHLVISVIKSLAIGAVFHGLSFYNDYFKIIK